MESLATRELPNSPSAEATVLGAIIIDSTGDAADLVAAMSPEAFYNPANRNIFGAITSLYQSGNPIELPSLANQLNHEKQLEQIGGVSYLAKLARSVPTASDVTYYIGVMKEKHTLRKAIHSAQEQMELAYNSDDAEQVVNSMQIAASDISDQTTTKADFKSVRDVLIEVIETTETKVENAINGVVSGIHTGYTDLDQMTAGLQKGDLMIVAARPSVGKTAFALNIAQNVAVRSKETVAIFSLEMSAPLLVQRMVSAEVNLDASTLRTGSMREDDWNKLSVAAGILGESNLFIDDPAVITVHEIRAKCKRLKKEKGLGLIVIDYLQLIQGRGSKNGSENRQQEVSEISRTLKQIARELDVPVIALSQLSRGVEQRQDKRPMMSDLRESGSIEQDADIVSFLYRDDYYNQDSEKKNIIEVIIAKQRNGPTGTVELVFLKNFNKFVNYERAHVS
ncbi:replicative DNA helicase [Paenibacillus sp. FSL H3-0310]|uniref:replicative DNA helicase n=1 Tax=Paenibacillus sp. FSL H3-0310 TaxID=2921429 RepID=UPI0030FAEE5D